jgi:hypothetical protein
LRGWLADEGYLRTVAGKLDEVAVSPLYLDERQRAEQMARVLAAAVDGYFDDGRRGLLAGRLYAIAEHLVARGDHAHARLAAATARALRSPAPAQTIPFARLLVEKAFPPDPAASAAGGSAAPATPAGEPAPLIVAPR